MVENKICSWLKTLHLKKSIGRTLLGYKDSAAFPSLTNSVERTPSVEFGQRGGTAAEEKQQPGKQAT